jgi:hypothetical protein
VSVRWPPKRSGSLSRFAVLKLLPLAACAGDRWPPRDWGAHIPAGQIRTRPEAFHVAATDSSPLRRTSGRNLAPIVARPPPVACGAVIACVLACCGAAALGQFDRFGCFGGYPLLWQWSTDCCCCPVGRGVERDCLFGLGSGDGQLPSGESSAASRRRTASSLSAWTFSGTALRPSGCRSESAACFQDKPWLFLGLGCGCRLGCGCCACSSVV